MIVATLLLTACQKQQDTHQVEHPATITKIDGSDLSRVALTNKAIQRLGIKTASVQEAETSGTQLAGTDIVAEQTATTAQTMVVASGVTKPRKVVPYAALLYDPYGKTWVYTSPEPGVFVRQQIKVDFIEGDKAFLTEGPSIDTQVVMVGVAELYGAEFKVGH
jgi:hypothetical protein